MKKTILLTALFGLVLSGSALAYDEQRDDPFRDATLPSGQIYAEKELNDAIRQRQFYYLKQKIRNNAYKNRKNQQHRHIISRAKVGANEVSTFTSREGELKFAPYYDKRRTTSRASLAAPNNAKRNFRTRAYDYYIEGGEAGKEALENDVILSSQHQSPARYWAHKKINQSNAADLIAELRNLQRNLPTTERVAAGHQTTTFRRGDSRRNFLHPFMNFDPSRN